MAIQFALRVPRRVTLGAICNVFNQVPPTFEFGLLPAISCQGLRDPLKQQARRL